MANRNFPCNKLYQMHTMPVLLDCNFVVGASGAVGTLKGPGVASVTRLSAGIYQIQLQDNYNRYYGGFSGSIAPVSGTPVADGSFTPGTVYVITTVGTTNWHAAGLPAGITPVIGAVFKAANAGLSGTGVAETPAVASTMSIQVIGNPNTMLAPNPSQLLKGGYINIQCVNDSATVADPAAGSVIGLAFYLSNSSIMTQGE